MGLKAEKYLNDNGFEDFIVARKTSLNFFDIGKNSNKFYTLEIHHKGNNYRLFSEYGRVGMTSKKEVRVGSSLYEIDSEFDKIKNSKEKKGYVEIDLAQSNTGSDNAKALIDTTKIKQDTSIDTPKTKTKSKLSTDVQIFIKQIFEEANQTLNRLVKGNLSSEGVSPLGKLSLNQIEKGRRILQDIAYEINKSNYPNVEYESNDFFKHIPKSFGRVINRDEMLINSLEKVNEYMDILQFYEDSLKMKVALSDATDIDAKYDSLNCDIELLDSSSKEYKDLVNYVNSTESKHHNVSLGVKRIFTLNQNNGKKFDDSVGNVKQLFHGTRSANMAAILSSHLKLPNQLKGVHITGAMFGGGLYFADQSTKSSQYSCSKFGGAGNKHNSSFMFVADVALGKVHEVKNAHYFYDAPKGCHSVKGVEGPSLLHNEYIVYNEERAKLRYIIEFETHRKRR